MTSLRQFFSHAELAALALRGFSDLDSLNQVERFSLDCAIYEWLARFERALIDALVGNYPGLT
jgi:hypothetical protein